METITLYHGSQNEITEFRAQVIYASSVRVDAEQYSLVSVYDASIDDDDSCYACGGGHLYSVEIPLCDIEAEEDFDSLDCGGYQNPSAWELPVVGHKESGYHFIKNAAAYVWQKIA